MATPITIEQAQTTPFEMAYGPNPIVLDGLSINWDKYVLRVYKFGSNIPIADVRQAPNTNGMAIFDLRNIIQSQVGPVRSDIETTLNGSTTNRFSTAGAEHVRYQVAIGYQQGNNEPVMNATGTTLLKYGPYLVYAGAKHETEVPFPVGMFTTTVQGDDSIPVCTELGLGKGLGRPFSDQFYTYYPTDDTIQTVYNFTTGVVRYKKYPSDWMATTWFNKLQIGSPAPDPKVKGIEAFDIVQYNGSTLLSTNTLPNIVSYGGGPNVAIGDGTNPDGPYSSITIASGPGNLPVTINANTTHYYIIPLGYTNCPDPQQQVNVTDFPVMMPIRVDLLDPIDGCDFYPFEFSWVNSLGYKDSFTFIKRYDRDIVQNNNTYLSEYADYASTSYDVNTYDRGITTYSQNMKQTYTTMSDWMTDEESYLLRSLYRSADVKVKFDGKWYAANLLTTSWTEQTIRKNKLFQYTVKFEVPGIAFNMRG